jgi:hypothetical protein
MWIFTRYGFVSIACARSEDGEIDENTLMVRARSRKHLENLRERFPNSELAKAEIMSNAGTDYSFRVIVSKAGWAMIVSELVTEQTWSNFKNEASRFAHKMKSSTTYVHALHQIWEVMFRFQENGGE